MLFRGFLTTLADDAGWLENFAERVEIDNEEYQNTF